VPALARWLALVAVALVAACGVVPVPPTGTLTAAGPTSTPSVSPSPTPTALSRDDLLTAIRFRRAFGLRDDEAWIREVAANPASARATVEFGTPLLPAEAAELLRRTANMEQIAGPIRWYGEANPDTWAGMFIDHQAGGAIVAQFSARADVHGERLSALLPAGARFEVREATWSLRELEAFGREAELAFAGWVGTQVRAAGVDEALNQVVLSVESRDPADPERIREQLGNPAWLGEIAWDHPDWTGPRGDLVIEVVDARGRPIEGLDCRTASANRLVPDDTFAYSTNDAGRCIRPQMPAVEYVISIWQPRPVGDGYILVGSSRALVEAGGRTHVRIVVAGVQR
jgi:hypothetical protein